MLNSCNFCHFLLAHERVQDDKIERALKTLQGKELKSSITTGFTV